MKKWLVGLVFVAMAATMAMGQYAVDFEGEGETKTAYASATVNLNGMDWDMTDCLIGTSDSDWKNGLRSARMRGYGASAMTMLEDLTTGLGTISFQYRRYGTATQVDWRVEYSTDAGTSWTQIGSDFTAPASDDVQTFSEDVNVGGNVRVRIKRATESGSVNRQLNIDDITMTTGGPAEFGVSFDKTEGFEVEEGTATIITATAAHGVEPYSYSWETTMAVGDYIINGDAFGISGLAPLGSFSATVTATDSSDPAQEAVKTINFSVVAPLPKYAIAITPPVDGSVTTTPSTEAEEGQTVTVNATPDEGYSVGSITVTDATMNPVTVTGNTFTMPGSAVNITVTFVVYEGGALIISQYYEGSSLNKWIEIYNPGSTDIDLEADGYRLGQYSNDDREAWKTGAAPGFTVVLSGTLSAGGTHVVGHSSAVLPDYATPQQAAGLGFNGDDSVILYTGETYAFANVVDAFGLTGNTATDKSFVRKTSVTVGVNTDFNPDDWEEFTNAAVDAATPSTNERIGYHSTGPAVFSVFFDKADAFEILEGAGDAITATAINGVEPYSYEWVSTLSGAHYEFIDQVFTILPTAPVGSYSATVTVTDGEMAEAVNTLQFSVVEPPPTYDIFIQPAENGTVTTTPADTAEEGQTVTVNTTPNEGYALDEILVVMADTTPVVVTGNTFVMPAQAVYVTATFVEYEAPDALIDFETGTLPTTYAAGSALLEDGNQWSTDRVIRGNLANDKKVGTYSARLYPVTDTNAVLQQTQPYAEEVVKLSFWVASYGTDNMAGVTLLVEVSANGTDWEAVATLAEAAQITDTLVEHVIDTLPAGAVYVRFVASAGAASNKRINVENIGVFFSSGPAPAEVTISGDLTGTVGTPMSLTIDIINNLEPVEEWWVDLTDPDMENPAYTWDPGTGSLDFTPAKVGTYVLTATAVNSSFETIATKTQNLVVSGSTPGPVIVGITMVTDGNGDFWFTIPVGYTLVRLEGANLALVGGDLEWLTLVESVDYNFNVLTDEVVILTSSQEGRLIRIVMTQD